MSYTIVRNIAGVGMSTLLGIACTPADSAAPDSTQGLGDAEVAGADADAGAGADADALDPPTPDFTIGDLLTYNFDAGSPTDRSGNDRHGALWGAVPAEGKYGQGVEFDASVPARVLVGDVGLFSESSITIEAWLFRDGDGHMELLGDFVETETPRAEYALLLLGSGGGTQFITNDGCDNTETSVTAPNTNVSSGIWSHLAVTWDGSEAAFFVDGMQTDRLAFDPTPCEKSDRVYRIGGWREGSHFNGRIDDLKISSYPKTAAQIEESMSFDSTVIIADQCGDQDLDSGEACDDGNNTSCDGCSADCTSAESLTDWYPDYDRDGLGDAAADPIGDFCAPTGTTNHVSDHNDCNDRYAAIGAAPCVDPAALVGNLLTLTFDEDDASDSSGNGLDGLVVGAVFVDGKHGRAIQTDRQTATRLEWTDSTTLFAGGQLTFEAWILREEHNDVGAGEQSLFGDYEWFSTDDPVINAELEVLLLGEGAGGFRVVTNGGCAGPTINEYTDNGEVPVGAWTHVATTWDGLEFRFYINGELDSIVPVEATPCERAPTGGWFAGGRPGRWFDGIIDDLEYSDYAKTVEEIRASMAHDPTAP